VDRWDDTFHIEFVHPHHFVLLVVGSKPVPHYFGFDGLPEAIKHKRGFQSIQLFIHMHHYYGNIDGHDSH
jgi:hypothetical protein